jgi:hypothetical protein
MGRLTPGAGVDAPLIMDATDFSNIEIDERFLSEWVEFGVAELEAYLTNHARFEAWCARRDRAV